MGIFTNPKLIDPFQMALIGPLSKSRRTCVWPNTQNLTVRDAGFRLFRAKGFGKISGEG